MDYTCWGMSELIEELEKRDAQKPYIATLVDFARNVNYNDSRYAPKEINSVCDRLSN